MSNHDHDFELVHGSSHVFRASTVPMLSLNNCVLASLPRSSACFRPQTAHAQAEALTYVACRICPYPKRRFARFTVDKLMKILSKLDEDIEVSVTVGRRSDHQPAPVHV